MFSTTSSGSTSTTFARMKPSVRRIAPYSCFVVRISSSGRIRSERITALSADVALGVKTRSLGDAPTKAASAARASHSWISNCRTKKDVGSRLELALEALVLGEDLDRAGPVAAVVEVGDPRVEEKAVAHAA